MPARNARRLPKHKDKSNGWTFTHPFEKMKQYQRALFWKHLFPFVWPGAEVSDAAYDAAMTRSEGCTGEEAQAWADMAWADSDTVATSPTEEAESDDPAEDEPLAKRAKK